MSRPKTSSPVSSHTTLTDIISSSNNPIVKKIKKLQSSSKERYAANCFILEGENFCRDLMRRKLAYQYFVVSESFADKSSFTPNYIVTDRIFTTISDTLSPQGILAVCKMLEHELVMIPENCVTGLLLENIQDPGNLGTILRTAAGSTADCVLLVGNCADIYNPKVVRASAGAVLNLPIYQININRLVDFQKAKYSIFATVPPGKGAVDYRMFEYAKIPRKLFAFGNESGGLSEELLAMAFAKITIPLNPRIESLNVSSAVAGILFSI